MGEREEWSEPVGEFLNGLLPGESPVIRALDAERWFRAEERTGKLIACIQPNPQSEQKRNAVADYIQQLIMNCFPCQVCTFGSVPLKTYLPDGDIDLTALSYDQNLKDNWANQVIVMLENEEKNENAKFHVKEVQYIQAEVKLIKCLVENIVVDISFNQVGGLCTLCFLDEVDHLIGQNHLFKRSIILIKAWCYYESRILGATHGLISTYALETLVLYIFHVFNKSFHGPLEVLYRFLEFFSNFDWDRFCVSLWGPVPISSLPDVTARAPRKDNGDLLFSKSFLYACSSAYAVLPAGQENNGPNFVSKNFNVIDPLRVNNNLGRSVSKGNFYRIRSAFSFGAKRLARLLDCPKEKLILEVDKFFLNTWERHGSGLRRDAAVIDSGEISLLTSDIRDSRNSNNEAGWKSTNENCSTNVTVDGGIHCHGVSCQHGEASSRMIKMAEPTAASHLQSLNNKNPKEFWLTDKIRSDRASGHLTNDSRGRLLFARTRSSPELTDASANVTSQLQRNFQVPASLDARNMKKNPVSIGFSNHIHHSSAKDASSVGSAHFMTGVDGISTDSNTRHQELISDDLNETMSSSAVTRMDQEEQEIVNKMTSYSLDGFNSQLHVPFGLSSAQLPFHIPPSFLASMGYTQRNLQALMDPPFSNMQHPHGFVSSCEASIQQNNENLRIVEKKAVDADADLWTEEGVLSSNGYESDNGNSDVLVTDHKPQASVSGLKYVPPPLRSFPGSAIKVQQKHKREGSGSLGQNNDSLPNPDDVSSELYAEERSVSSKFSSVSRSNSLRSRTSSESSWDGSSLRTPNSTKEKRAKKVVSAEQVPTRGKGRIISDHMPIHAEADDQEWVSSSSENAASLQVPRHYTSSIDISQSSDVNSMIPFAPMLIDPRSRQKTNNGSGLVTFYQTGPPIPFFTMLPLYNIPETDNSDAPSAHFAGDEIPDANESTQNFSPERFNESEIASCSASLNRATTPETPETRKTDILSSDFASHWQNLQLGRFCQNPGYQGPVLHPSHVMVPPVYLPGQLHYDNSGRPLLTNMSLMSQMTTNYGRHFVPVAPLQSVSSRPPNMYQHYMDDMPRYRSGTGTYLPKPVSVRECHSSGGRRGNYRDEKNEFYGDKDGNWNANSNSRGGIRSHNRSQIDKSSMKADRLASTEIGTVNSWNSYRHEAAPPPPHPLQNGSNSSQNGPQNVAYSTYPLAAMNPNGHVPPVVMLYPFSNKSTIYGGKQLEFGSLGPVGFPGTEEQLQLNDHKLHGNSGHWSSPAQPASPHYQSHKSREH